jgi:type I restriction enzyme M protein
VDSEEEVLPLEEAVVLLREAKEERAEADRKLDEVLKELALGPITNDAGHSL